MPSPGKDPSVGLCCPRDVPWCCPRFITVVSGSCQSLWPQPGLHIGSSHTPFSYIQLASRGAAPWEVLLFSFQTSGTWRVIITSFFFSTIPRIFPKPHNVHSLPKVPHSSSEADTPSLHMVPHWTLCRGFVNCKPETTVVPRLEDTCGRVYHARTTGYLTQVPFSEIRAHLCQSKHTLVPDLTQHPKSKSTLSGLCREDFVSEWTENKILTPRHHSSWASLHCCLEEHQSLFPKWPGGSRPGQ